jgi:hypothetical protein
MLAEAGITSVEKRAASKQNDAMPACFGQVFPSVTLRPE